ncbi:cellulase family glycosylhydrolase [Shinella kummerowiae]|uniref:Cellulase family glycosylhydrolase n=1 Tax=Shinella kummerowiae TaxID=417745 RepID=A0A6N8SNY5_9HYPH|nr:cellulase family glycosylhydrolase [Shinella kummerowiae]MXN48936.1 cellulase family glycosylhydrolase [Shinella kummerowiae]
MARERAVRSDDAVSRRATLAFAGAAVLATALPSRSMRAQSRSVPSRGINIPAWLDRENGQVPADPVLDALFRRGFRTVRLPVDCGRVLSANGMALRDIREGVSGLVDRGFAVLMDMHPSADLHALFLQDAEAAGERVLRGWETLRGVIADLPADRVYPELLNEPPMENTDWLALRDRLAQTVRRACPDHTIVWGPAPDQGIWQLDATPPLPDDKQIAAVHFYAPMAFTHQCQSWGASPLARISGLPFPATRETPLVRARLAALRAAGDDEAIALIEDQLATPWTETAVRTVFEGAARWSERSGCPVMLNEFGVLDVCVDAPSRLAWIRAVRKAAEASGIGWAYWDLDQGFGLMESRLEADGFDAAMLDALFGEGD